MPDCSDLLTEYLPLRKAALDHHALLQANAVRGHAVRGQCLISDNAELSSLIILCGGMARKVHTFPDGVEQIVAVFVEGDVLNAGEVVFSQSLTSIYALSPAQYLTVPLARLHDLIAKDPTIARTLWLETAAHAAIQQEWMIWLGRRPAQSRLAHFLCELSWRLRAVGRDLNALEFPLTQSELADALGLSTVHVNRSLQALRGQGLIELTRGRLTLLNEKKLQEVAEFNPRYLGGARLTG